MTKNKYTHCLTLRLESKLDELLTEAAYDRRITKSDWIRGAIRGSLKERSGTKCAETGAHTTKEHDHHE